MSLWVSQPSAIRVICVSIETDRFQFWGRLRVARAESTASACTRALSGRNGGGTSTLKSHSLTFPPLISLLNSQCSRTGLVSVLISNRNLWVSRRWRVLHWTPCLLQHHSWRLGSALELLHFCQSPLVFRIYSTPSSSDCWEPFVSIRDWDNEIGSTLGDGGLLSLERLWEDSRTFTDRTSNLETLSSRGRQLSSGIVAWDQSSRFCRRATAHLQGTVSLLRDRPAGVFPTSQDGHRRDRPAGVFPPSQDGHRIPRPGLRPRTLLPALLLGAI